MMKLSGILLGVAAVLGAQPGIEGNWQGGLPVQGMTLHLGLHITRTPDGFTSTVDSIDQGAMGIPVKETTFSGGKLHLNMATLHAEFEGTLSSDGREIAGTFTQGAPISLTWKRVEKVETARRPQTPKPPFPYDAIDVSFEAPDGIRLAGTLTLPRGQGPFPAAILISGSGPQDRDETLFQHKPFLVIADYLTRRGIAVLRVDDRGVGKSTGSSTQETLDDMAGDVLAGVSFLKARKDIDARHIGLMGHSEGGIVAPAVAARSADIAFVVMLAGTGVNGEQILYRQAELANRAAGASDEGIAKNRQLQQMIFDVLRDEPNDQAALGKMRAGWSRMKAEYGEAARERLDASDPAVDAEFRRMLSPEMRSFLFYDPAATLRKVKAPVLALNGERDFQVPPGQNLPAIRDALSEGGNRDFTVTELPGLNHLFQKCTSCTAAEYATLEETFSPAALEVVGDWILKHTGAK